jgi:transglutaminase-like putative cysteine protease
MKGNFFNLPPALRYRYTLSSTNVPYKHPRVISFVERWIKDDEIKTREETVETILKAVNLYTVPRKEPLSGSMNETGRNQKTDVTRMQWGSGALYALAHPESCGPSERADLLTAALRDRNIPVRRLYGHLLSPSGKTMIPHVWCEVFISPAGWVPADPTSLEENVQPILGLWSERYVFISREGPDFIVKSGPDRALLQEGYSRAHTKTMDIGIEVTRVVIDETTR